MFIKSYKNYPQTPTIAVNEGVTGAVVEISADIATYEPQNVTVSYAAVGNLPSYRNWNRVGVPIDSGGLGIESLEIFEGEAEMLAYVSCYYKDGFFTSSLPVRYNHKGGVSKIKSSHIIYERKMGLSGFVADTADNTFFLEDNCVLIKEGALDLAGITVLQGDLSTYVVGDERYKGHSGALLQFDVCPEESRGAEFAVYIEEDGKVEEFSVSYEVKGGEWQKRAFPCTDFKNAEKLPLKSWDGIKKASFKNAAGMLFNNILWV
jgi:hypothetical protein